MGKWIISLSNGETIVEDSNRLNEIYEDNRSSYRKLMNYCEDNKLKITGIRIQVAGRTHTFSASPKAKFPCYLEIKEIGHRRRVKFALNGKESAEQYINYYIIIGNIKIILWVCEKSGDSWLDVQKISQTPSDTK